MYKPSVAKNTIFLTSAFVGQKILAFLYFTLIARLTGVEGAGKYFFALSLTTIFSVFVDFGLSPVLIRESSKRLEKAREYLNNILGIKFLLSFFTFLIIVIFIHFLNYSFSTRVMVYLAGIVMILDSFHLTFYAVFRSLQNLKYEARGVIIGQAITLIFGSLALIFRFPLYFLIIALLCGSLFQFFYSLFLIIKKLKIIPSFSFNKSIMIFLFKIALPFALAGIFVKVYSYLDTILLSKLVGELSVGWYSVAYKITYAFQFIPMAMSAAIFPAMSSYFAKNKEFLIHTFEKSLLFLLISALPIAFGIFSLAEPLILNIYGQAYFNSIFPLQISIFALIFIFLNFPIGSLLNACDKQVVNTSLMGLAMFFNIILNIFLIPRYAMIGASIASLAAHGFLFFTGMYFSNKVIRYNKIYLIKSALKTIIASGLMAFLIIILKPYFSFLVLIPLGAMIYFILLWIFRAFTQKDFQEIYHSFFKKVGNE